MSAKRLLKHTVNKFTPVMASEYEKPKKKKNEFKFCISNNFLTPKVVGPRLMEWIILEDLNIVVVENVF